MFRISRKGKEIILRDVSLGDFVKIGLIASATLFLLFFNTDEIKGIIILYYIAALGLLSLCFYYLGFIQIQTVKINKKKRILSVQKRSLIKNTNKVYRFGEIADLIFVDKFTNAQGEKSYKLMLRVDNGERIGLSSSISSEEKQYFEAADLLNNLIFNKPVKIPQKFIGFNKF